MSNSENGVREKSWNNFEICPRPAPRLYSFKQSYMYVHCAVIARKTNLIIFSNNF